MKTSPADRFHAEFVKAIAQTNLTSYKIGQLWAAGTDERPDAMRQKLDRWVVRMPKMLRDFVSLMDALNFEVKIVRRPRG